MPNVTAVNPNQIVRIAHAVPGRLRLQTIEIQDEPTLAALAQQVKQVLECQIELRPATGSLILEFEPETVALPQLLERLQPILKQDAQPTALADSLQPSGDRSLELNVQTALPLLAGWALTSALGLQGLMAMPVFIGAEVTVREGLKQLEKLSDGEREAAISTLLPVPEIEPEANKHHPQLAIAYTIVHRIPGRLRLRVPQLAIEPNYGRKLTALAQADPRITAVRLNVDAASIAVSYDPHVVNEAEIQSVLVGWLQLAQEVELPQAATPAVNPWANLGLPAVTTVLAVLSGSFGLPIPPLVVGGAVAIAAIPVAQRALESIVSEHRLNIDVLDLMAIAITLSQGQFLNPALMISLIEFGEAIREQTAQSSKQQALDLLGSLEQLVWVERNGEKQQIAVQSVQQGDTVVVYPGGQVPVDGTILQGKALIDEQKLTGEATPVLRAPGQFVYASTLNRDGCISIRAEALTTETRAGQILKVMQDAPVHDTRVENYAAAIADRAVVPTILLSGILYAATGNLARAASVLTLDLATGIRVSVPTTVLAALTCAAQRGILIRSGRALEKLAQIDTVVFDKTGTLTQGEPLAVGIETLGDLPALRILELAAAAEQRLTHPVAQAVVRYAQECGAKLLPRGEWSYQIGSGVQAEVDGQTVLVGSRHFLQQSGIAIDNLQERHRALQQSGHSTIYVASNGKLQGAIVYRDPLRPESCDVVRALQRSRGMEIHLLTGDSKRTAAAVARELGIAEAYTYGETFPEQKVAVVKRLHAAGKTVAFVGDGINDSPALAYAEVSVSFGNGSDVARETADIVLMENNLRGLPEAIAIAQQAMQLIHQNTAIVAVPNLVAMGLAVSVGLDPLMATLVNNGSTIVAGLNGLRPLLTNGKEAVPTEIAAGISDNQPLVELPLIEVKSVAVAEPSETAIAPSPPPESAARTTEAAPDRSAIESFELAQRLRISYKVLNRHRSRPNFPEWSRCKDPEGIAWHYNRQSKSFSPS